jgi:hypothetical protein
MLFRYFEVEVVTPGYMRVGWTRANADPAFEVGNGLDSYGFDGFLVSTDSVHIASRLDKNTVITLW